MARGGITKKSVEQARNALLAQGSQSPLMPFVLNSATPAQKQRSTVT